MKKVVTLGPAGTYSEIATKKLLKVLNMDAKILFEPSIDFCFEKFKETDYLVLPLENSIDGYIQRTLDLLNSNEHYYINKELSIPITFSLVSNEVSMDEIETVYVQFKTQNQCLNFFHQFKHLKFVITDSNVQSLNLHLKNPKKTAAVVPTHLVSNKHQLVINHIEDELTNQTRFVLIEKKLWEERVEKNLKVLLVLSPNVDRPGLLYNLLGTFAKHNINLSSIMSRPKKDKIGTYHFFLELNLQSKNLKELLQTLKNSIDLNIKILGVYA
ncbi:ACT domain-containing protein [Acholeplasma equirhinis]|uniref:prephenate dehydratase n=1 Tax=Acholeplasma equirhinis TaxID=555393 RepID=UPI00197A8192|nr:prephenate dehydratase domain-containing protein [Acholeplasma equirhinis]MBN3490307.1 ACT domain-containing protein [Acholeplasma equirhinis]